MNEINTVDIVSLFEESFEEYAMYTIEDRAIPDIRDGLKPVHRKIIYEMLRSKNLHNKPTVKVAKIVGQVMGLWHPHGDVAIKDTLVGLNQIWKKNLPLIDVKGNYGSVYGDKAGAARYIEARLTEEGEKYGTYLKEGIVEYEDNYDGTLKMPKILPAELPYLLINGIEGIAVGFRTLIPPHNPQNVIDTYKHYIRNPKATTKELLDILQGPDFPIEGYITNKDDLLNLYETGYGTLKLQGKIEYKEDQKCLQITQVPFTMSGSIKNIVGELIDKSLDSKDGKTKAKLPFITDVSDYSGKDGINIQILIKRGTDPDFAINEILKHSSLRSTMSCSFMGLNERKIRQYSLKDYFEEFLEFRLQILRNEHILRFKSIKERQETLEGYLKLQADIDTVIALAKKSTSKKDLEEKLKELKYTENQARNIASLQIYQINRIDYEKYKTEYDSIPGKLKTEWHYINSVDALKEELIEKLPTINKPRKTIITNMELKEFDQPKVTYYVKINGDELNVRKTQAQGYTEISSDDKIFAADKEGVIWNYYLDSNLQTGTYSLTKLLNTPIIGGATLYEKVLVVYTDGHAKFVDADKFQTKSKTKKIKSGVNDLEIMYFANHSGNSVLINEKEYDNLPNQGLKGRGRKIVKHEIQSISEVISNNEEVENSEVDEVLSNQ